jgi:hypothetical protein
MDTKEENMKIPEKFNESRRSQTFRETQPMHIAYKLIDMDNERFRDTYQSVILDVRVFWPNHSETCKAIVWVRDEKESRYGCGVGITSGYGYRHESAAIYDAMRDLGIKFDRGEAFDAAGTSAQEKAVRNLGEALGYKNTFLVDFNP